MEVVELKHCRKKPGRILTGVACLSNRSNASALPHIALSSNHCCLISISANVLKSTLVSYKISYIRSDKKEITRSPIPEEQGGKRNAS